MNATQLDNKTREALEQFLMADNDQEKQEQILNDMRSFNNNDCLYLKFLRKLRKSGTDLGKEFNDNYFTGKDQIEAQQLFLKYDEAKTDKEREEALDNIIKRINVRHNHTKPYKTEVHDFSSSLIAEEENQDDDQSGGLKSEVDQKIFKRDLQKEYEDECKRIVKDCYQGKITDDNKHSYYNQELNVIKDMPDYFLNQCNFSAFRSETVYRFATQLRQNQKLPMVMNSSFFDQVKKHMAKKDIYIDGSLFLSMTLSQLDKIKNFSWTKSDPNIVAAYFQKQFYEELSDENQQLWTNQEKYDNLIRLLDHAKNLSMPKSLLQELTMEILKLGPKINHYSKDYFMAMVKYVEQSMETGLLSGLKNMMTKNDYRDWSNELKYVKAGNQGPYNADSNTLLREYLTYFGFQNQGDLSGFKRKTNKFMTVGLVEEIETRCKILCSKTGLQGLKDIAQHQFQQFADNVILKFLPHNKDKFRPEEHVQLSVEIKNVKSLHVKVFEFNTETYYKKTLKPFNSALDLDGLESSYEQKKEYKWPSNYRFEEQFDFPELTGRVGLFIVEFIGNGVSARAVIKKGSLSLIHRSTIAGHMAYIIDDDRKICKGKRTGIWFNKKFYESDEKTGHMFIPYAKSQQTSKVIMIHEDFAQLGDFTQKREEYGFTGNFFLSTESILVGSKCKVVMRPQLTINGRMADLSQIKNANLQIMTKDYIDNIPVTKKFSGLKFENDKELTVSFQVPANLETIHLSLNAQVMNATDKRMEDHSFNKTFNVQTYHNTNTISEVHLKKEDNNYYLMLLGKNGEPWPRHRFDFKFLNSKFGIISSGAQQLATDKNGCIKLGPLEDILQVDCTSLENGSSKSWHLPLLGDSWTYPGSMTLLERQPLVLPINIKFGNGKKLDRRQVSLIRSSNGVILEDWFDKLALERLGDNETGYHIIKCHCLDQGDYQLVIRGDHTHTIDITVHKGENWNNVENFILKKSCITEIIQSQKFVKIAKVSVAKENEEAKESTINIQLADNSKGARVHMLASTFLPTESFHLKNTLHPMVTTSLAGSRFTFAKWENILLGDRQLCSEFLYVYDRREQPRQLGNTLDRPTLLNKRLYTRETEIEQEVLNQGSAFEQVQEKQMELESIKMSAAPMNYAMMQQNIMPLQQEIYGGGQERFRTITKSKYQSSPSVNMKTVQPDYITDLQNFLKNAPLQVYNLVPNQDGLVQFKGDISMYQNLTLIVIDQDSILQREFNLANAKIEIPKRDMTLNKTLDENKGLTQTREAICLSNESDSKYESSNSVEDITSSELQIIDDLKKVYEILQEIQKLNHESNGEFRKLEFVLKWSKLSDEEKNRYFTEYACHELNFFIKKKDNSYFESVVRPYLLSKMEKTFFDHFLLDNFEEVKSHTRLDRLMQLNALEKCMLIDVLVKLGDQEQAQSLADNMYETIMTQEEDEGAHAFTRRDRIFDLVLNLNSLNQNQPQANQSQMNYSSNSMPSSIQSNRAFGMPPPPMMAAPMMMQAPMMAMAPPPQRNQASALFGSSAQNQLLDMESEEEMDDFCANQNVDLFSNNIQMNQIMQMQQQHQLNRVTFEKGEATQEFMETHYFGQKLAHGFKNLIQLNAFIADYAQHLLIKPDNNGKRPSFISKRFTDCTGPKIFLAICLLDLPFEILNSPHEYAADESRGVNIKAGCNMILFKKYIKEVTISLKNNFMVTHRYAREDGRANPSEQNDAIPKEFLVNTPYSCEVIMTNVSPQRNEFQLLYQIPKGSMPMRQTKYMKSLQQSLEAYSTKRIKFNFYFPSVGKHEHYPSNVSMNGEVTARGESNILNVVRARTIEKPESLEDLISVGTEEQILDFIRKENLFCTKKGFQIDQILYLLKSKDFFDKCIAILRERQIYFGQVWSYALLHKHDIQAIKEWLACNIENMNPMRNLGPYFKSSLIDTTIGSEDVTRQNYYKHLEYHPMINSRAHKLGAGGDRNILNVTFRRTYDKFLQNVAQKQTFDDQDKLQFIYYLQLQDRVDEAIKLFNTVKKPESNLDVEPSSFAEGPNTADYEIQYDYLNAYFDFFTGHDDGYKIARRIAQKYDNYPISSWRLMFLAIEDQIYEIDGEFDNVPDDVDMFSDNSDASLKLAERKQENMKQSKQREPNIAQVNIDQETGTLTIETVNLKTVNIKYYSIDAEVMFSRAPFLKNNAEEFSYVKPFLQIQQAMIDAEQADDPTILSQYVSQQVPIPEQLKNQNLVIEVNSADKQIFKTFYSSDLKVTILESFGELKVTQRGSNDALSQVYVKVFAQKKNGSGHFFYRDGYTDIRGKFEYAQTAGDKLKDVKKFSILVQDDKLGSMIREADPPVDESDRPQEVVAFEGKKNFYDYLPQQQNQMGGGQYQSMQRNKQARMFKRNANYAQF